MARQPALVDVIGPFELKRVGHGVCSGHSNWCICRSVCPRLWTGRESSLRVSGARVSRRRWYRWRRPGHPPDIRRSGNPDRCSGRACEPAGRRNADLLGEGWAAPRQPPRARRFPGTPLDEHSPRLSGHWPDRWRREKLDMRHTVAAPDPVPNHDGPGFCLTQEGQGPAGHSGCFGRTLIDLWLAIVPAGPAGASKPLLTPVMTRGRRERL